MKREAYISPSGFYRYWLARGWDMPETASPRGRAVFIMLNPSTADAELDDPTIRRCIGFARREGFGQLDVINLFAGRATQPDDLFKMVDPVGPRNVEFFRERLIVLRPSKIICAWGADKRAERQASAFLAWAEAENLKLSCLGRTKAGAPRHPLYVRAEQELETFA